MNAKFRLSGIALKNQAMKITKTMEIVMVSLAIILIVSSCSKEELMPLNEKKYTQGIKPKTGSSRTTFVAVDAWEDNGVEGPGHTCFPYPCDCLLAVAYEETPDPGLALEIQDEFEYAVDYDDWEDFFANDYLDYVNLPLLQKYDLLNEITTIQRVPNSSYFNVTYDGATSLDDKPDYYAKKDNALDLLEWNFQTGVGYACYPFPCDCISPRDTSGMTSTQLALLAEFNTAVDNETINNYYENSSGQSAVPLPPPQMEDIINDVVTIKRFEGISDFHIVYMEAEELEDRPEYLSMFR